jgi:hypothetical protein
MFFGAGWILFTSSHATLASATGLAMSYLVAIGVVIVLGAVTGLVWQERAPFSASFRKVRPNR